MNSAASTHWKLQPKTVTSSGESRLKAMKRRPSGVRFAKVGLAALLEERDERAGIPHGEGPERPDRLAQTELEELRCTVEKCHEHFGQIQFFDFTSGLRLGELHERGNVLPRCGFPYRLSVEQNFELDKVVPIIASVKTKLGRGGSDDE
jgi:hypothetical protein